MRTEFIKYRNHYKKNTQSATHKNRMSWDLNKCCNRSYQAPELHYFEQIVPYIFAKWIRGSNFLNTYFIYLLLLLLFGKALGTILKMFSHLFSIWCLIENPIFGI
jgi:hypothetical protein